MNVAFLSCPYTHPNHKIKQERHYIAIEWMEAVKESTKEISNNKNDLINQMLEFYTERDWTKFHSPKNLAMNLGVEVGELMEHFRWATEEQSYKPALKDLTKIHDEIGDVYLVLIHLANVLGIDPIAAAHEKLAKIGVKYPKDKCKGQCHKYTEYE
jgi:dCTP diphosphatase